MSILPSDTPRLPKWPFLLGDAVLLACAVLLAKYSPLPYANPVIIAIAGCVALAAILGVAPFLTDYAGKQDEALDERQRGLEALTRTVANSAEQISVAATSLHELTEVARQQLAQAEALPDNIKENLQGINEELAKTVTAAGESLRQEIKTLRAAEARKLDAAVEKIQLALAGLNQAESVRPAPGHEDKPQPGPIADQVISKPTAPVSPRNEPTAAEAIATDPGPAVKTEAAKTDAPRQPTDQADTTETVAAPPKPKQKTPPPKKSKPPEPEGLPVVSAAENNGEFSLTDEDPVPTETEKRSRSIANDGATRLYVTAYIGIGNRLFLRGDGAGLNPEKGVPLQFVSIGKWQWETKAATGPLHVRLYKNDEVECLAPGELVLDPGHQVEVSASF